MSFQRRVVLPPLALAVHPAPPPKVVEKKDEKEKEKKDDKEKDKGKEQNLKPADKDVKPAEAKEQKLGDAHAKPIVNGDGVPSPSAPSPLHLPLHVAGQATPPSPGSMVPEPGTPGTNEPLTPAPAANGATDVPQVPPPQVDPKGQSDKKKDGQDDTEKEKEEEAPPPPLRLLGPVPHRPIRTKLDLNPAIPYPPINTDPRGAYYKYAKYMQGEWILIDIPKDGWLAEQWREKPEREALARLRGESDKVARREAERMRQLAQIRQLPESADAILLDLWNDLVEALNHECTVDDFWARYDWSSPQVQKHLKPARRTTHLAQPGADDKAVDGGKPDAVKVEESEPDKDDLEGVEWTKEGLEEILGTVGVQCSYNTAKPLPRSWAEPSGAYLVLGHGYFMLRTEDILQWKPEESANKFEVLVTSGHDRVFGEMVKAQQAEERKKKEREYRERKLAERKKAEEEHRRKKKAAAEKEKNGEKVAKPEVVKEDKDVPPAPRAVGSDHEVKDGELVEPAKEIPTIAVKGDKAAIAVPVPGNKVDEKDQKDQHEVEVLAAAPGEATNPAAAAHAKAQAQADAKKADPKGDQAKNKDPKATKETREKDAKKPFDPMKEAELLAKMVASGQTPPGVGMEDIKLAFKALEAAAGGAGSKDKDKKDTPVIWTWHDSCERWRWKNYEAGLHNVGPGGWEERDWKVFADDRGCAEFDLEESWAEEDERDIFDWSC